MSAPTSAKLKAQMPQPSCLVITTCPWLLQLRGYSYTQANTAIRQAAAQCPQNAFPASSARKAQEASELSELEVLVPPLFLPLQAVGALKLSELTELDGSASAWKGRPCKANSSGGVRKRIWPREKSPPLGITVGVMPVAMGSRLIDWLRSTTLAWQLLRNKKVSTLASRSVRLLPWTASARDCCWAGSSSAGQGRPWA